MLEIACCSSSVDPKRWPACDRKNAHVEFGELALFMIKPYATSRSAVPMQHGCCSNSTRLKESGCILRLINCFVVGGELLKLVPRHGWQARDPKNQLVAFEDVPAKFVIVGDCSTDSASSDLLKCCDNIRKLQDFHMTKSGLPKPRVFSRKTL
jgi:hypothetical protein